MTAGVVHIERDHRPLAAADPKSISFPIKRSFCGPDRMLGISRCCCWCCSRINCRWCCWLVERRIAVTFVCVCRRKKIEIRRELGANSRLVNAFAVSNAKIRFVVLHGFSSRPVTLSFYAFLLGSTRSFVVGGMWMGCRRDGH